MFVVGDCNRDDYDALAEFPFLWFDLKGERSTLRVVPIQLPTTFPP